MRPASPLARAGRNLALKTVGEVSARLSLVVLFILAARLLGAQEYGRYSFAAALAALSVTFLDLGMNTIWVRDGARDHTRVGVFAGSLLVIKSCLALLILAGVFAWCLLSAYPWEQTWFVMAVTLVWLIWGFLEMTVAGLNALERMDQEAMVKGLGRLMAMVLGCILILSGLGVWGLVLGLGAANLAAFALGMRFLLRHTELRVDLSREFLTYLARQALPLALTGIFILVYFRVDVVMLKVMGSPFSQIGWYAAGVRIIDAVGMVPAMVAASLLPVLSSLAPKEPSSVAKLYLQGRRLLTMIGLPAAAGLFLVREKAALLIYGAEFTGTGDALAWLAPMLAFLFVNYLQLTLLTALGRQKLCAVATGACVFVNLGLNLALIPSYGYLGAAAATLATELTLFLLCAIFVQRLIKAPADWPGFLKPLACTALMALPVYFMPGAWIGVSVGLGILIYAAAMLLIRGVTLAELGEMLALLKGLKAKRTA